MAACASVGIEHNRGTGDMLRVWMDGYHQNGHVEPAGSVAVD